MKQQSFLNNDVYHWFDQSTEDSQPFSNNSRYSLVQIMKVHFAITVYTNLQIFSERI